MVNGSLINIKRMEQLHLVKQAPPLLKLPSTFQSPSNIRLLDVLVCNGSEWHGTTHRIRPNFDR